jgi:hypothetical protein
MMNLTRAIVGIVTTNNILLLSDYGPCCLHLARGELPLFPRLPRRGLLGKWQLPEIRVLRNPPYP